MRPDSPEILEFLLTRGAGRLAHPGGSLYEHLNRVAALLAEWGADEDLQVTGLCHACYGTDGYGQALLTLDERPVLRALAGARVESLVYLYGSCDRAAVYPALAAPGPVRFRDRFTGRTHTPTERDIRAFTELTAANELDVMRHSDAMAARHEEPLQRLFAGAAPRLTDAARQAWTRQGGRQHNLASGLTGPRRGELRRTAGPPGLACDRQELLGETSMSTGKPEVDFPGGEPPSELQITEIWEGTGSVANPGDTVQVHYVGVAFSTGEEFDASWDRGEPLEFRLGAGRVIAGWDQGVQGMKVGGRRQLIIPPDLAYGDRGAGNVIAPGETLIFVCDLVAV